MRLNYYQIVKERKKGVRSLFSNLSKQLIRRPFDLELRSRSERPDLRLITNTLELVELIGIEPTTSGLQSRCSPS